MIPPPPHATTRRTIIADEYEEVTSIHKGGRWASYPSRYGQGKVHRIEWDPVTKQHHAACRTPGDFTSFPHGRPVADDTPVTCKRCGT
jgi:hypothetical protein